VVLTVSIMRDGIKLNYTQTKACDCDKHIKWFSRTVTERNVLPLWYRSEWVQGLTRLSANGKTNNVMTPFDILVATWARCGQLSKPHFHTRCLPWSTLALTCHQSFLLMWINCLLHRGNCIISSKLQVKITEIEQCKSICELHF